MINVQTDFLKVIESKGMSTSPFAEYVKMGVTLTMTPYMVLAKNKEGAIIAKYSSAGKAIKNIVPTAAAEILSLLKAPSTPSPEDTDFTLHPTLQPLLKANLAVAPKFPKPLASKENKLPASAMAMLSPSVLPQTGSAAPAYPILDPGSDAHAIFLRDAKGLYCRVKGSNKGSVYLLLADFGALKMAGRWLGGKLALRFEAADMTPYLSVLSEMDLGTVTKQYASIHVGVSKEVEVRKMVMAMIGAVGVPPLSPLPSVSLIKNKGA